MNKKSNNTLSSPESRGNRLKILRSMANLTQQAMSEKFALSIDTLRSWENARATGLTEQGAKRIITALRQVGINCSLSWLLSGKGASPYLETKLDQSISDEDIKIAKEVRYFIEHNPKATYHQISDEGLAPKFSKGDIVAGCTRHEKEINQLIGKECIVELPNGTKLTRLIRKGTSSKLYDLCCTNINSSIKELVIYDCELVSAAPIIWHRKKDLF